MGGSDWSMLKFQTICWEPTRRAGFQLVYINYTYEHEAIRIPKSENNIGAPSAPQKSIQCIYESNCLQFGSHGCGAAEQHTISGFGLHGSLNASSV